MWSRFFCLSVYVTMYLNDHQRRDFYQTLGMNVDVFDRHVITETNKTTERIFPVVPDHDHPDFFPRLHRIYEINESLIAIDKLCESLCGLDPAWIGGLPGGRLVSGVFMRAAVSGVCYISCLRWDQLCVAGRCDLSLPTGAQLAYMQFSSQPCLGKRN